MTADQVHFTEHQVTVAAAPEVIYELIADVSQWPLLFPPTIHAERVSCDDSEERIRLWALANDAVGSWTSRRWLDRGNRHIRFRQEVSQAPVRTMSGEWIMRPADGGRTEIALTHEFSVIDDDPDSVAYVAKAIDQNSEAELAAVRAAATQRADLPDLILSFSDSVLINGDVPDVYDFIYRCQDWPERLPHVARLSVREEETGLQVMEMDTRAPDGEIHTTKSVRLCFPPTRIVYRQLIVPPIMAAHTGRWLFTRDTAGVRATSAHTVMIEKEALAGLLGPDGSVAEARQRIREALGTNSLTTLRQAKAHVEKR